MAIKLLLIEDDTNLSYIIKSSLEEIIGGYHVSTASNADDGLEIWKEENPDIIVSDIEMPGMNGIDMVAKIRQSDSDTPIIFASAKTSPKDVTSGYSVGVNNYIKKPFLPEELHAHVTALLNLKKNIAAKSAIKTYQIGKYLFNVDHYTLELDGKKRILTGREAQILELLCDNKGSVVKRDDILIRFWEANDFYTSRSLDVFITKMRRYFVEDDNVSIKTIKGVGLVLTD